VRVTERFLTYHFIFADKIVGETLLIVVRSSFLCVAVIFFPEFAVLGYSIGALCGAGAVCLTYYGYFYFTFRKRQAEMPFTRIQELFPSGKWVKLQYVSKLTLILLFKCLFFFCVKGGIARDAEFYLELLQAKRPETSSDGRRAVSHDFL